MLPKPVLLKIYFFKNGRRVCKYFFKCSETSKSRWVLPKSVSTKMSRLNSASIRKHCKRKNFLELIPHRRISLVQTPTLDFPHCENLKSILMNWLSANLVLLFSPPFFSMSASFREICGSGHGELDNKMP